MAHRKTLPAAGSRSARSMAGLAIAMGLLAGCLFNPGDGNSGLAEGGYFVSSGFDANYMYEEYFVVLPEGRWHWVQYGSKCGFTKKDFQAPAPKKVDFPAAAARGGEPGAVRGGGGGRLIGRAERERPSGGTGGV